MIKTYKGMLADGGQDIIPLHTPDGKTGYRIVKFELMPQVIANKVAEHVIKLYKTFQTTIDGNVDFSDNTLLAAGFVNNDTNAYANPLAAVVIFDQEIFNQDIYVTHKDMAVGEDCNYYIELEQVKLTEEQALVTIVKNLRTEQ